MDSNLEPKHTHYTCKSCTYTERDIYFLYEQTVIYTYKDLYIHIYIYIPSYIRICICIFIYMYMHVYMYMHEYTEKLNKC